MTSTKRRFDGRKMAALPASLLLILVSACAANEMPPSAPDSYKPEPPAQSMPGAVAAGDGQPAAPAPAQPAPPTKPLVAPMGTAASARSAKEVASDSAKQATMEQMIIFSSRLDLEVDAGDVTSTLDKVVDIAAHHGGYIHEQTDTSVTVRVPSADFREAMRDMEKTGEVVHRSVQAQDVSEEFNDLDVRLKSLLATRARMQQFLERAKDINEVLRVEQELTRMNGEIDRLQGRMRFLQARAAFSTITVALRARAVAPKVVVAQKVEPPPPPPPRTLALPIEWLSKVGVDSLLRLK